MRKYVVTLTREERDTLLALTSKGKHSSQTVLNALILLGCDEGEYQTQRSTNEELSRVLKTSMRKINRVKSRFVLEGLDEALTKKKPDRIYDKKTDGDFEARLIALSCSEPPE
ncbi:MAG: helix-turn-helix domain-containing protein, partial [Methanocalculus sp.]|uniref:helix-turn-helix domain-containing protein n=1 Tax=Methanocalculus sp. TaxID=2004547 RepID=UPI002716503C